jgi:hypothetical protein
MIKHQGKRKSKAGRATYKRQMSTVGCAREIPMEEKMKKAGRLKR